MCAGGSLRTARRRRARRRHVAVGEVGVERGVVDVGGDLRVAHERAHLRGEREGAVAMRVEQRLLAEAVARDQQAPAAAVPEREGEHAVQVLHAVDPVLLVEVHDHLRVALGREAVAGPLEPVAQLAVVVDLAVEDDHDRAVLVGDRLVAGREVDHAQALDAEPGAVGREDAPLVGAAMLEARAHLLEQRPADPASVVARLSDDPAHG